jgi:hypothetical protein
VFYNRALLRASSSPGKPEEISSRQYIQNYNAIESDSGKTTKLEKGNGKRRGKKKK